MDYMLDVFEFLHGKNYTLNGLDGVFKLDSFRTKNNGTRHSFSHEKSEAAKQTEQYLKTKDELGDDWSTDMTLDIERTCNIATELGFIYQA
jgi:hypothetical protein